MTSEGLGEMFEGDYAERCAGKFPLMSMGGRTEGLPCPVLGARTPIGVSGNFWHKQSTKLGLDTSKKKLTTISGFLTVDCKDLIVSTPSKFLQRKESLRIKNHSATELLIFRLHLRAAKTK